MHGMQTLTRTRPSVAAAVVVAAGGAATMLGAYYFQYVMGLPPCPLCLQQRIPYYIAIPFGLVLAVATLRRARPSLIRGGLATLIGEGMNVDDLAAAMGTASYEVLTSLGRRYHRIYKSA